MSDSNKLGDEMCISTLINNTKDEKDNSYQEKINMLTEGQINPDDALLGKYRNSKKVQILFSVPECIKMEYLNKAIEKGFYRLRNGHKEAEQKKFFYYLLRENGIEIPTENQLNKR